MKSFIKVKECEEKVKHQLCSNIINTIAEICSHDDIITVSQVKAAARGPQQEPMTFLFHCYAANYHQDQLEQSPKLYSIKQNLFSSINNISVVNVWLTEFPDEQAALLVAEVTANWTGLRSR